MIKKTALEPAALVILSRVLGLGLEDTSDGDDCSSDCVYFAPFSSTKEGARPAGSFQIFCVGAAAYIGVFSGDRGNKSLLPGGHLGLQQRSRRKELTNKVKSGKTHK
jgi:hypothetical protein